MKRVWSSVVGGVAVLTIPLAWGGDVSVRVCRVPENAPAWAIPYGAEYWRIPVRHASPPAPPGGAARFQRAANAGEVVERVHHAFRSDGLGTAPVAHASTYEVDARPNAISFRPSYLRGECPDPVECVLRTRSVTVGEHELMSARPLPGFTVGNVAQACLSEAVGIVEHAEARSDALYVTWCFAHALPNDGDLSVHFDVGGMRYAGATARGHHFADASDVSRVCVGPATLVDSTGARWPVATHTTAHGLAVTVPRTVLACVQAPFCVDPAVSAEFGLDSRLVSAPAVAYQLSPSICWNGTEHLVVWEDTRVGDAGLSMADIFAARVTPTGAVLDPFGIPVCTAEGWQRDPDVAWNGTHYLVAWSDQRAGDFDVYGARITSSGVVVETNGVPLHTASAVDQDHVSVASDGTDFLAVWEDARSEGHIRGRRIAADGVPAGVAGQVVNAHSSQQDSPSVAWGGTNYFLAWQQSYTTSGGAYYSDVYGTRLDPNGVPVDAVAVRMETSVDTKSEPDVTWGAGQYFVAWKHTDRPATPLRSDIYGTRVSTAGQVLDAGGIQICTQADNQMSPSVTFGSTDYLVVWEDGRGDDNGIYASRVSTAGVVQDGDGLLVCDADDGQLAPCVAWNGSAFLVAWEDTGQLYDTDILAARVLSDGSCPDGDGYCVSYGGNSEWVPSAAWGDTNYLVVWEDDGIGDGSSTDIRATRLGPNGTILDPAGIDVCVATNAQNRPVVAWNGSTFLVAWEDERNALPSNQQYEDLYAARVSDTGTVLDPGGIGVCTNPGPQYTPCVAADDAGNWLLAWRDYRVAVSPYPSDIYGSRMSAAGTVMDPTGIAICTATESQFDPTVAFGEGHWFVAWEDDRDGVNPQVYGTRVSTAGTVLDASGIPIGNGPNDQANPSVAWGDDRFLCVWQDARNAEVAEHVDRYDIYGARVSGGVNLDTVNIPVATNDMWQTDAAVAWTGDEFLCLWEDQRNSPHDIWGARVDRDGTVLDGMATGFALVTPHRYRLQPCIAARSNGMALVTYSAPEIGTYNAMRATALLIDTAMRPITLACGTGGQVMVTVSNTYPDRVYDLMKTPSLAASSGWAPLGLNTIGNGGTLTFTNALGAGAAFYRATATPR
ncbi:MAG: hypothetical protein HN919_17165 [Verrucomicrobia bacterium]|jgi:large repetitive protein|nr:hypothetical protein [Verrucomicrobiota bacterium]MBT7068032.1 hypothetical protein [Verrucomicrobiota bacterium]MBT7699165.1 hypothetical protein [Verrucomicrobiota bacterium]